MPTAHYTGNPLRNRADFIRALERLVGYYRYKVITAPDLPLEDCQRPYLSPDNPRLSTHYLANALLNLFNQDHTRALKSLERDPALFESLLRHEVGEACRLSHTLSLLNFDESLPNYNV